MSSSVRATTLSRPLVTRAWRGVTKAAWTGPILGVMSTEGGAARRVLTRDEECALSELSPFEFKSRLLELAADCTTTDRVLDAGRGNPNWVATTPRAAFFLLGQFALDRVAPRAGTSPTWAACRRGPASPARLARVPRRARRRTTAPTLLAAHDRLRRVARVRRRRVRVRARRRHHRRPLPGPRPDLRARRAGPARVPRRRAARGHAARRRLGPVRGRGRHRGDLLRLRLARDELPAAARATASR